jgi:hypothetical protein
VRKFIAILLIVVMAGFLYYHIKDKVDVRKDKVTEFDKIISLDLEQKYPDTVDEVIMINNQIVQYLYGGNILQEEIEAVVNIQRNLFDSELIKINPIEIQIEKVKVEIEKAKEDNLKIIDCKYLSVQYQEQFPDIARVKVLQYTNTEKNNFLEYYLKKQEDNTWKIVGWKKTEEFVISEEL